MKIISVIYKLRKILISLFVVIIILLWGIQSWLTIQWQDYEDTPAAFVVITSGPAHQVIDIRVQDIAGHPLVGITGLIENNSGGTNFITDSDGRSSFSAGEQEVSLIYIGRAKVLDRPHAAGLGYPTVSSGLSFMIIMKNHWELYTSQMGGGNTGKK